jgi:hypothetical protein
LFTAIWAIKAALGKLGPKDRERLAHGLGLWAPDMREHWQRLREKPNGHALINIGTEWFRKDPQRAFKVSFDSGWAVAGVVALVFLF